VGEGLGWVRWRAAAATLCCVTIGVGAGHDVGLACLSARGGYV
jgi:hypothetical protein